MANANVAAPRKKYRLQRESSFAAALFLAPALVSLAIWFVYPLLQAVYIGFHDYNFMFKDRALFIGLENYATMLNDPEFYLGLRHTLLFVVIVVPVQTFMALLLATLVNQKLKARGFFRTVYYMPYVLSAVAVATVFMYYFVKDQMIAKFFSYLGFPNVTWFADVKMAMPFIGVLYAWQMLGFYMIYYLSGLQTIPAEIYEASQIDGATRAQTFFYVTVPSLKPTTFLVVTYGIIQSFQLYDQISIVTTSSGGLGSPAGATTTLLTFFYVQSFKLYKMGYGSAIAIMLFVIILIVSVVQRKLIKLED